MSSPAVRTPFGSRDAGLVCPTTSLSMRYSRTPRSRPQGGRSERLLRHCRAVVFTDNVAMVGGTRLELHPELGLLIGSPTDGDAT